LPCAGNVLPVVLATVWYKSWLPCLCDISGWSTFNKRECRILTFNFCGQMKVHTRLINDITKGWSPSISGPVFVIYSDLTYLQTGIQDWNTKLCWKTTRLIY
jgi:hypothetical protein